MSILINKFWKSHDFLKFDNSGVFKWGTYFGGSGDDWINAIEVDGLDHTWFTGESLSRDFPFSSDLDYGTILDLENTIQGTRDEVNGRFNSSDDLRWAG